MGSLDHNQTDSAQTLYFHSSKPLPLNCSGKEVDRHTRESKLRIDMALCRPYAGSATGYTKAEFYVWEGG